MESLSLEILPTYYEILVDELDHLTYLIICTLFVVMHLKENTIPHKLISLTLNAAWYKATKHSRLSISLL